MYGMPLDLLARVTGITGGRRPENALSNMVARWRRAGWVETGPVGAGPRWVWATQSGVDAWGKHPYQARRPGVATLAHHRAVALQRRWIETTEPLPGQEVSWTSERELRWELGQQKGSNSVREHVVDGVVTITDPERPSSGTTFAVEVELTAKPYAHVVNNMRAGRQKYGRVLWLVTPATRPLVERAYDELRAQDALMSDSMKFDGRIRIEEVYEV